MTYQPSNHVIEGEGFLNDAINKLSFEVHLPGHKFTGPGTKLAKRLNPDDTPKEWSKPINRVDAAAMRHDICYRDNKDTKSRNSKCDKNMLDDLSDMPDPTMRERLDRGFVKPIISIKKWLGMGVDQQKKR